MINNIKIESFFIIRLKQLKQGIYFLVDFNTVLNDNYRHYAIADGEYGVGKLLVSYDLTKIEQYDFRSPKKSKYGYFKVNKSWK